MTRLATFLARGRCLAATAVAAAALGAAPGSALAADCNHDGASGITPDPSLVDSLGFSWDLTINGVADDGYNNAAGRGDAFDAFGHLLLSGDGTHFDESAVADANACTTEEDGQEIVYPDDGNTLPGVTVGRKVLVPATGLAFARWLDSFTNTTGATRTFVLRWGGNLGSDNVTTVAGTSSGDSDITAADHWTETFQAPLGPDGDPLVTIAWDGRADPPQRAAHAGLFDPFADGFQPSSDDLAAEYSVTLAPGQTKRFLHVVALRLDGNDQAAATAAIDAEPAALRVGLSADEIATLQNWTFDGDGDGVLVGADNCATAANAGQEDLDGDGQGDACDDDVDGDWLSNAVEAGLRTNPRSGDSDGDGKPDASDSCPAIGATSDDGCPLPVVLPPAPDRVAPVASLAVAPGSLSVRTLLKKGLTVRLAVNEPASFRFDLIAAAKGARLAKVGDLVVASKSLGQGSGRRTIRLVVAKRWRHSITRETRLTLRTQATDLAGNRATTTKRLKLSK